MQRVSTYLGAVVLTAVALTGRVEAQFVTRWVNANGVITFSTSSPPPGVEYEAVPMPAAPKSEARPAPRAAAVDGASGSAAKAGSDKPKPTGAANLKIEDQSTASVGESQWVLSGKVKNEGGIPAEGVAVHVSVLEDGQGNPCLDDRGSVSPSTIPPGETGTFELTYNSPCFFGSPRIEIVAEWQK